MLDTGNVRKLRKDRRKALPGNKNDHGQGLQVLKRLGLKTLNKEMGGREMDVKGDGCYNISIICGL